jgi:hypothetical protein
VKMSPVLKVTNWFGVYLFTCTLDF